MQNYQLQKVALANTVKEVLLKKVSFQIEIPVTQKESKSHEAVDASHQYLEGTNKLLPSSQSPKSKDGHISHNQLRQSTWEENTIPYVDAHTTMEIIQNPRRGIPSELDFYNPNISQEASREAMCLEDVNDDVHMVTDNLMEASSMPPEISNNLPQNQTKVASEESQATDQPGLVKIEQETAISYKDRDFIMVGLADDIAQKTSASKLEIYAITYIIESAAIKVFGVEEKRYQTVFRIIHYCIQVNEMFILFTL